MKQLWLIILAIGWGTPSLTQNLAIVDADFDDIPYKKVRNYLLSQQQDGSVTHFSQLKPTCEEAVDSASFSLYTKTYIVKQRMADVWNTYLKASPTESWKTRKSAVGLVYDRSNDSLIYAKQQLDGTNIGQVMYLHLKVMKGLYRLATALEVTRIKEERNTIEISYVDHGVNEGKQWIEMSETPEGYTLVKHTSMIRSESRFRDKYLYPFFHNKLINAFHRNMKRLVYSGTYAVSS